MLEKLETFLGVHTHTIAAVEAISTLSAVIVSLAFAIVGIRAQRTKIKAAATIKVITHSSLKGMPKPRYVTVELNNVGMLEASIPLSFFFWKLPLRKGSWSVIPSDCGARDPWIPQKKYPVAIPPRTSMTFFLNDIATFRAEMRKVFAGPRLATAFCRLIGARVVTADGRVFRASVNKALRQELLSSLRASYVEKADFPDRSINP